MKIFAERLKELREELGLSQRGLAKAVGNGISPVAICYWETEQRVPRFDAVVILAKFFKVSTDYLGGLED